MSQWIDDEAKLEWMDVARLMDSMQKRECQLQENILREDNSNSNKPIIRNHNQEVIEDGGWTVLVLRLSQKSI